LSELGLQASFEGRDVEKMEAKIKGIFSVV
jgi:hypothetical protein